MAAGGGGGRACGGGFLGAWNVEMKRACEWRFPRESPGMAASGGGCRKIKFKSTNQYCHMPWRLRRNTR